MFRGDLRSITGYGYETRALASLFPQGWDVFGVDLHHNPFDCQGAFNGRIVTDEEVTRLCRQANRRIYIVNHTPPNHYAYFPGAVNIGSFAWETSAIPSTQDWPELICTMDYHWAKSSFIKTMLQGCGLTADVPIIAWPIDFDDVPASDPARMAAIGLRNLKRFDDANAGTTVSAADLRKAGGSVLLSVSSMAPRKGLPVLLSEWRDYIAAGGSGVLLLKLRPIHNERFHGGAEGVLVGLLAEAGFRPGDAVNLAYTFENLGLEDLRSLYAMSDAYVTTTFGEGFGGPVVEALTYHRPVIAPRHSSLTDLLPPDDPLQVDHAMNRIGLIGNSPIYPHDSSWGVPTRGALVKALHRFEAMSSNDRAETARRARDHARAFCSKSAVAAALKGFFERVDGPQAWS